MSDPLRSRLVSLVEASPTLMTVLRGARDLGMPDWRVSSGAVYQTVWNDLTGRPSDFGVKDYDTLYFDPDTTWEAEDVWIKRAAEGFPPHLADKVEVRNQARVHLWFESKFGEPYSPLSCTDESLERYVCPCFAVAVRLEADDSLSVAAPFGLDDLFAMRLRPNPRRAVNMRGYEKALASLRAWWPEIQTA